MSGHEIVRPRWHFSPRHGWINDPNGLVWFKGRYHMYFQCNPYHNEWGKMHWGHAVSEDLVHWKECEPALVPDQPYEDDQKGGCFSGSVVVHGNRLYAFYTAAIEQKGKIIQKQCAAYSEDGFTFVKPEENPIISECPGDSVEFRDPKVIFCKDRWQMLVGGSSGAALDLSSHGRIYLYHSRDLLNWDYDGILYEAQDGEGTMFECPDIFKVGEKWVITASPMNRTDFLPTLYMTGMVDFRNCVFCREHSGTLDFGPHYYASQVYRDRDNRMISVAWLGGWDWMPWINDHGPSEENGYRGIIAFPRLISMDKAGRLRMEPYQNAAPQVSSETEVTVRGSSVLLSDTDGTKSAVRLRGFVSRTDAVTAVKFLFCDDEHHHIELTMDLLFGNIITDFREADLWTRNGMRIYKAEIEREKEIRFEIIRDGNVLEVYWLDGTYNFTSMIYPTGGMFRILASARGAGARIRYSVQEGEWMPKAASDV